MFKLKWLVVVGFVFVAVGSTLHAKNHGDLFQDEDGNLFILVDVDGDGDVDIDVPAQDGDVFNGPGGLWVLVDVNGDGDIDGAFPQKEEEETDGTGGYDFGPYWGPIIRSFDGWVDEEEEEDTGGTGGTGGTSETGGGINNNGQFQNSVAGLMLDGFDGWDK